MSKGVSQIATAALYIGITVTAISIAITVGAPALENMRDAAAIQKARGFMQRVDTNIQTVSSEGRGSTRTLNVQFDRGKIFFENASNSLVYELKTDAAVISPQSSKRFGNVVLSSNAAVTVENSTVGGTDCYMMSNRHVEACIKKIGGPNDMKSMNVEDLLVEYNFTDSTPDRSLDGKVNVKLNGLDSTSTGRGYTRVAKYGNYIGTGKVVATLVSDYGYTYDIIFSLPTGADFLKVDVRNFR